MAVYLWYDAKKNPDGRTVQPGVPLDNIEEKVFKSYPKWLQKSLEASPAYVKSNPNPEPRTDAAAADKSVEEPVDKAEPKGDANKEN